MPKSDSKFIPSISIKNSGLIKVGNSVQITNKILEEHSKRELKPKFKSIIIGSQEWMIENLSVECFRNGDPIHEVKDKKEWNKVMWEEKPAWCHFNFNSANIEISGKYYNWYAVNDPRGLSPKGWHIPINKEWSALSLYLGGIRQASSKMRSNIGWEYIIPISVNSDTNSSGFTALPSGYCFQDGRIIFTEWAYWWSHTKHTRYKDNAWAWCVNSAEFGMLSFYKGLGLAVRCIKD